MPKQAMSEFSLERKLPSCAVTPELLKELERRIRWRLTELPTVCEGHFSVSIRDGTGTETFGTLDDFPYNFFLPGTLAATIEVRAHGNKGANWNSLYIRAKFSDERMDSDLMSHARERTRVSSSRAPHPRC